MLAGTQRRGYLNASEGWVPGGGPRFGVSWTVTLLKQVTSEVQLRGRASKFHAVPLLLSERLLKLSMEIVLN